MPRKDFVKRKIVKVRKDHECGCCNIPIKKGEYALHESGWTSLTHDFFSTYFHVYPVTLETGQKYDCLTSYIDIIELCGRDLIEVIDGIPNFDESRLPSHQLKWYKAAKGGKVDG